MPSVDVDHFAVEWQTWWNALQPTARRGEGENPFPRELTEGMKGAVVQALQKTGPSGMVVVLVGLKWWAPGRSGRGERWSSAVDDVAQCLKLFVVD